MDDDALESIRKFKDLLQILRNIIISMFGYYSMLLEILPDDVELNPNIWNISNTTELKDNIKRRMISQGSLFPRTDIIQRFVNKVKMAK